MQHLKHYIGLCLLILTIAVIVLVSSTVTRCTSMVDRSLASVRNAFAQVFNLQPTVTINQRIVLTQTEPIAELAVVTNDEGIKLDFDAHFEVLSVTVPLTDKKISAQAVYHIKAGFDLHENFSVDIDPHQITLHLPHAKILSVEQAGDLTLKGDDALLNHITDAERNQMVNALLFAARDAAAKSTLKADAEQQVAQRLKDLLHLDGISPLIQWTNPAESPIDPLQRP